MITPGVIATEPDPLDVIEEEARAVVQFFGVQQCDRAAEMLVGRIAQRLGGRRVYVAADRNERQSRDARIRLTFNGANYADIAATESISERQVRNIVHRKSRAKKKL
jgi:Mor family transcriptional regulator